MKFNAFFKTVILLFTVGLVISCDKDFNEVGADLIDDIHYDFDKADFSVLAYNAPTGPVQTSNLPINSLGYYKNSVFGETTATFLTQLELATVDPKFYGRFNSDGVTPNPSFVVDSVYLYVPYFSKLKSTDDSGDSTYELDSVHGRDNKLKLSVFRSQYFLRNLDPDLGLQEQQRYYSNEVDLMNSTIATTRLNNWNSAQNDDFKFSNAQIKILKNNETGAGTVKERLAPGLFLNLDAATFKSAILYAPEGKLTDNNVFKEYFKGLYFHAENDNQKNALARLNFAQGKITIVYKGKDSETSTAGYKRKTLVLNLAGNSVNFFQNTNAPNYNAAINNPQDIVNGERKLYLKGGEGSMAVLKLFSGSELQNIKDSGWLINEANLVFTIDSPSMTPVFDLTDPNYNPSDANDRVEFEPNRILLYDLNNKRVLIDYSFDVSTNTLYPKFNKFVHDGIIRLDSDKKGTQYKVRLTNHIRNLVSKDSTNVALGLVVTESINNINNVKLKNSFTAFGTEVKYIPAMSVASPLGTILWGNNIPASDPDYSKRLKLEIFYTKPD